MATIDAVESAPTESPDPRIASLTVTDRLAGLAGRRFPTHSTAAVPDGTMVELPGRGSTFVTDSGDPDGPAIVLLHSVMTTGLLTWYPTLTELGRTFRVITLDLRWHGRGIDSPTFSLEDCADDVAALADVMGLDSFIAAGYSMGGGVAQLLAHRRPQRVAGLVLAATGPVFGAGASGRRGVDTVSRFVMRRMTRLIPAVLPDALDERGLSDGAWALRQVRSTRLDRMHEIGAALTAFDARGWLADIAAPTAVCVTTRDRVVPVARQQLLVDGIPGASRVDVPAGHASCVLEPDAFVPAFISACADVRARSVRRRTSSEAL